VKEGVGTDSRAGKTGHSLSPTEPKPRSKSGKYFLGSESTVQESDSRYPDVFGI